MERAYLNLKGLSPVQLASKAQFVIQKMQASNYCSNPPIPYTEVEAKIELLMKYIVQDDLGEKDISVKLAKCADMLNHMLNSYVEYVQMQSHGDARIIAACGMLVEQTVSKISAFTSLQMIHKNLKALSVIMAVL